MPNKLGVPMIIRQVEKRERKGHVKVSVNEQEANYSSSPERAKRESGQER
jgi:hypothetical protein